MAESGLRPKGSVEVTCSFPGCGVTWWVSPLDPNLHGPHNCGQNHAQQNILDRQLTRVGIGVATQTALHGGLQLYVTQLFIGD